MKFPLSDIEDTLIYAIEEGKKEAYESEFKFQDDRLNAGGRAYLPQHLKIDFMKRFEGMSNPADSMVYFRISANDGTKGYYVSAYGIKANDKALTFLKEVKYDETYYKPLFKRHN